MKNLFLILFSPLLILQVCAGVFESLAGSSTNDPSRHLKPTDDLSEIQLSLPLDNVKLKIISSCKSDSYVNLKRTERSLANQHLPIWISREYVDKGSLYNKNNEGLERDYEVMKQLGEFTTYHDIETSSAAVYFHKRREFDGIIGAGKLIKKLSIDRVDSSGEALAKLDWYGVHSRPAYTGHEKDCRKVGDDPMAGVNHQKDKTSYEARVYDAYPEVLVIVSSTVVSNWNHTSRSPGSYTSLVAEVLTLFNGVDMLYSKLKESKIEINIAGIIIEEGDSFLFLEDCYFSEDTTKIRSAYKLGGDCVILLFRTYLDVRREKFSINSYDLVVYLTREEIYLETLESETEERAKLLVGVSGVIPDLYKSWHDDLESILVSVITYPDYLENYPVITHEMAHLMTLFHDKLPFFSRNGNCLGRLLKTSGGWCDECLSWSNISEQSFKLFFSSPNCCTMINKPRSLHPPRRQLMLKADEQCQCYGYISAKKFRELLPGFCQSQLRCEALYYGIEDTVIPMDGTPCGQNAVCWERSCKYIEACKSLPRLIME